VTLFHHTLGEGCPVVALHGWGLSSSVWTEIQRTLSARCSVTRVDLPGYGQSRNAKVPWRLEEVAKAVADVVTAPSVWMGWSLGGMVAVVAAQHCPNQVRALVLIASNPCFVQKRDWAHGLPWEVLRTFAEGLAHDYETTLSRFLSLQAGQDEDARWVIKRLRKELLQRGLPDRAVVRAGLAVLQNTDLRPLLGRVECPALLIFGEHDVLVPRGVAKAVSMLRPDWHVALLANSGHAPFLSHQTAFLDRLQVFLDEVC
jgi:pimeloyl-[acyl-carrier protein] methyl ester esterase